MAVINSGTPLIHPIVRTSSRAFQAATTMPTSANVKSDLGHAQAILERVRLYMVYRDSGDSAIADTAASELVEFLSQYRTK